MWEGVYKINSYGEHLLEENEMITYLLTISQLKSEGTTPRCSPEIEVEECVKLSGCLKSPEGVKKR